MKDIAVNRAERIRQRSFLTRNYRNWKQLQALAKEAHTIRDVGPPTGNPPAKP